MKCYDVTLPIPKKADHARLAIICCLHLGSRFCDLKRVLEWRNFVLKDPLNFAFDLGDDTENALPGDEEHNSMMWDQIRQPDEQFRDAADLWAPLVMKKKLIINHDSNHHWRTEAKTGRSAAKELNVFLQGLNPTRKLYTPEPQAEEFPRWGRWQALTRLHVGQQTYTIHSWHGVGSGCTPEAALRKCRSMAVTHEADLYAMGHAHQRITWSDLRTEFSSNGQDCNFKQRHYACTGGFIGWSDSYAERKGLPPNRMGGIVATLGAKRWDIKVST